MVPCSVGTSDKEERHLLEGVVAEKARDLEDEFMLL